jgi:N-acetylmuramic acid 6-phosphate etherase
MIIAIEGGATHTRAGLYDEAGICLAEAEAGPSNPVACGIETAALTLVELAKRLLAGRPASKLALWAGLAGAGSPKVQMAVAEIVGRALGAQRVRVTTDLHPVLFANAGPGGGALVIAGTGSAVIAKNQQGKVLRVGGRGAVFGDDGSAYRVAVEALRACAAMVDGLGPETVLIEKLPPAAGLGAFEEFVVWSGSAEKRAVADLARTVAEAADAGDFVARACLDEQARRLAAQAVAAIEKLHLGEGARVFLHGSLLNECERFRGAFRESVNQYVSAQFMECLHMGHHAVYNAFRDADSPANWASTWQTDGVGASESVAAPTEGKVFSTRALDELDAPGIVRFMNGLDASLPAVVAMQESGISQAVEAAAAAIMGGGRIIYLGAGTSGRLGVLDASECPPTFGVPPGLVVGLIAGGERALRESIEGEEDNRDAGMADLDRLEPRPRDFVVGIAASGSTPYVVAALERAKCHGCTTALVCCHPAPAARADIMICLTTGPEALAGSTRLRAGTATKMVLNIISTGAMALSGYVYQGLMVEMKPSNIKLRLRAAGIVDAITGIGQAQATELLQAAHWSIPTAIVMAVRQVGQPAAHALLRNGDARLRDIISTDSNK